MLASAAPSTAEILEAVRREVYPRVRPADIAKKADVSRQYVSDVLKEERPPSASFLSACLELGVAVDIIEAYLAGEADQDAAQPGQPPSAPAGSQSPRVSLADMLEGGGS